MLQRVTGSQWRLAKGALRLTASCSRSTSSSPSPSPNRTLPKIDDFEVSKTLNNLDVVKDSRY